MKKTVGIVQQLVRLGVVWVAVCACLVLAVGYTKTGLEALLSEHLPSTPATAPATPAAAAHAASPQPVLQAAPAPAARPVAPTPAPRQARAL